MWLHLPGIIPSSHMALALSQHLFIPFCLVHISRLHSLPVEAYHSHLSFHLPLSAVPGRSSLPIPHGSGFHLQTWSSACEDFAPTNSSVRKSFLKHNGTWSQTSKRKLKSKKRNSRLRYTVNAKMSTWYHLSARFFAEFAVRTLTSLLVCCHLKFSVGQMLEFRRISSV